MSYNKNLPKDEIIDLYVNKEKRLYEIAQMYNVSQNCVRNCLIKNNIKLIHTRSRKINNKDLEQMIDLYINKRISIIEISKMFNCSRKTIQKTFNELKIPKTNYKHKRIYNLNENYFNNINQSEQSYWFGFLLADGNIYKNTISIDLKSIDKEILEKFKTCINGNMPIEVYKRKKFGKIKEYARIKINSEEMVKDLKRQGMLPNKSLILTFPEIKDEYFYSFIRGYIDGDGGIRKYGRKFVIEVIGTEEFLTEMFKFFVKDNIYFNLYRNSECKERNTNIYYVRTGDKIKIMNFLGKLYKDDNNLHLDRKYSVYLEMIKELERKPVQINLINNTVSK